MTRRPPISPLFPSTPLSRSPPVKLPMGGAVPAMLVQAGLDKQAHWHVYLPAVALSFAAMGGLFAMERRGRLRAALLGAIALITLVQIEIGRASCRERG